MFSRDGSLLPSIYADARYIDAVIVSKAAVLVIYEYAEKDKESARKKIQTKEEIDRIKIELSFATASVTNLHYDAYSIYIFIGKSG